MPLHSLSPLHRFGRVNQVSTHEAWGLVYALETLLFTYRIYDDFLPSLALEADKLEWVKKYVLAIRSQAFNYARWGLKSLILCNIHHPPFSFPSQGLPYQIRRPMRQGRRSQPFLLQQVSRNLILLPRLSSSLVSPWRLA